MFYRAGEVLACHTNAFAASPLMPLTINFFITTSITSLICVLVSKFQDISVLALIGSYFLVIQLIMVMVLYEWSNQALLSYKFLIEQNQFKRKCGKEVSRTCQVISMRVGSFHKVNLNVLGIVVEAVINYTVTLLLNIENI